MKYVCVRSEFRKWAKRNACLQGASISSILVIYIAHFLFTIDKGAECSVIDRGLLTNREVFFIL